MKPIEALTSVPRSVDASRLSQERLKDGEAQFQNSQAAFSRELQDRSRSVNEAQSTDKTRIETESRGSGQKGRDEQPGKGDHFTEKKQEEESFGVSHPVKGKILDIRGA